MGRTDLIPLLFQALDLCEQPFGALLNLLSPDFVIHDTAIHWTPRVAAKSGIPTANFAVINMTSVSFLTGQHWHGLPQIPTAEDLCVRQWDSPLSLSATDPLKRGFGEGLSFMDRVFLSVEESWATVCNTCLELEGKFVDYFQGSTGRLMFPVGIFMPSLPPRPAAHSYLAWLDKQSARSIVFVSFGSECLLTAQELNALLLGLEESDIPFLCVLLGRSAAELQQVFEDCTPRGRGVLVTEWAPQMHILNHPSNVAFLSHCGWNSVTEGLRFGVPFVALPIQYDPGLTARFISEEMKMGVEVTRNDEDCSFTKEDIARAVRAVMVEEEGNRIRSNVEEISRVLTSNDCQVHRTNMHNFVTSLKEKASSKQSV